jgi:hypothetical protein
LAPSQQKTTLEDMDKTLRSTVSNLSKGGLRLGVLYWFDQLCELEIKVREKGNGVDSTHVKNDLYLFLHVYFLKC